MADLDLSHILGTGWGPTRDAIPSFSGLPFAPFSKHDKVAYVANWDPSTYRGRQRRDRRQAAFGTEEKTGLIASDNDDDDENEKKFDDMIIVKKRDYQTIAKYRRDRTQLARKLNYSQGKKIIKEQQRLQQAPTSRRATRRQVQNKRRRKKYIENDRPTRTSVMKSDAWIDLTDIWFRENFDEGYGNTKTFVFKINGEEVVNRVPTPQSEVLRLAGTLHGVLTKYDLQSGNTYKPTVLDFERFSDYKFCNMNWKSAIQDPYILELANAKRNEVNAPNIFTTENVLSAIMCCNRSKYSFDIVINKFGDKIFLDERNKVLSMHHVDETSQNRPTKKGQQRGINGYDSLAREATYINHVFCEQMLFHSSLQYTKKLQYPHPFALAAGAKGNKNGKKAGVVGGEAGQQVASQAFTYKQWNVTDNYRVLCRCAIDGFIPNKKGGQVDYARTFALTQYICRKSKTLPWRKCLADRDANILKTEIANNNFKCARWALKAHLAGAKYIKIGFVARAKPSSTDRHLIYGVKTFDTDSFVRNEMGVRTTREPWTVFAKFMKLIGELKEDGRYVAVRDPLKQVIRMYQVEKGAFQQDGLPSWGQIDKMLKKGKQRKA